MSPRATGRRPLQDPLKRPEQFNQDYDPRQERLLTEKLGVNVRVYQRGPGHMARGYADPAAAERGLDLAQRDYERVYSLLAGTSGIDATMARSLYALTHELGHLNVRDPKNEEQANAWAARHFASVLKQLGLNVHQRAQVVRLARKQLLV